MKLNDPSDEPDAQPIVDHETIHNTELGDKTWPNSTLRETESVRPSDLQITNATHSPDQVSARTAIVASQENPYAEFQLLHPHFIPVERIAGWIAFAVIAAGGAIGLAFLMVLNWPFGLLEALASGALVLILSLLAWTVHVLPALSYKHARWRLNEQGLDIRRGIWWRHEITIPLARVQHTDVHQGPLMRKYELAKLVIHTAGTQDASIEMDGLALETAHKLRDALIAAIEVNREQ